MPILTKKLQVYDNIIYIKVEEDKPMKHNISNQRVHWISISKKAKPSVFNWSGISEQGTYKYGKAYKIYQGPMCN